MNTDIQDGKETDRQRSTLPSIFKCIPEIITQEEKDKRNQLAWTDPVRYLARLRLTSEMGYWERFGKFLNTQHRMSILEKMTSEQMAELSILEKLFAISSDYENKHGKGSLYDHEHPSARRFSQKWGARRL